MIKALKYINKNNIMNYKTHITPFSKNFIKIKITKDNYVKANNFVKKLIVAKNNEPHYKTDNDSQYKRFLTGTLGELALEQMFGINGIVDWEIGSSFKYHKPDLKSIGLKVGVKTVNYGLFPIIFNKSYSPEIINIMYKEYIYVCGLATVDVLNNYQSTDLIKNPKLKARNTKTGFYGFEKLKTFNNLDELKSLII